MKKIYNRLSILIVLLSLLFVYGCDLEEHPMSDLSPAGFYETQKGIESLTNGIYIAARNLDAVSSGLRRINALGTDTEEAGEGIQGNDLNWYGQTPTNGELNSVWNECYALINYCNYATKYIPVAADIPDDVRKVREAEARFFRAHAYYHLTMHFGDVHFSLEASEGAATEANRTPVATIYDEGIYPDLRFAAANLPAQAQVGRLNSWAGKFMLGFALLSDSRATTAQWNEAAGLYKDIIDNGGFALMSPYDVYAEDNEGKNTEAIFSYNFLPYNASEYKGSGNQAHLYYICTYDQNLGGGLQRTLEYGRSYVRYRITDWLLDRIDETIDCRFDAYFRSVWLCNYDGGFDRTYKLNGVENTVHINKGDTIAIIAKRAWTKEQIDARPDIAVFNPESSPSITPSHPDDNIYRKCFNKAYASLIKFEDTKRAAVNDNNGGRDNVLLRLANAYLLASEAYLRAGNKSEALKYFNTIRRNAAFPGKEADMEITEGELDIDEILNERGRELCGEWYRWADLKRLGKLPERAILNTYVIKNRIEKGLPGWEDKFLLRPIPQPHIDRCTNEYPQNPGYE
jgi:hypothetical protein